MDEVLKALKAVLIEVELAVAKGEIDRLHPVAVQAANARRELDVKGG